MPQLKPFAFIDPRITALGGSVEPPPFFLNMCQTDMNINTKLSVASFLDMNCTPCDFSPTIG